MLGNGGGGWPEHWVGFHQGEEGREDRLQEREDVEGAQAHMGAGEDVEGKQAHVGKRVEP